MTFLKKHWRLAIPVVMIAFLIFYGWRVISQHARVIDLGLFILLGVGILLIPVTDLAGQILSKLKEQATAVMNETTKGDASVSWPSPRTHRQELELAMVGRMGDLPLSDPALAGKHVKTMLDALEAQEASPIAAPAGRADLHKCLIHGVAACPCHKDSDDLLRSAGYPADLLDTSPQPGANTIALQVVDPGPDAVEREIQAKGLTAPRVTKEDIEAEIVSEHYFVASDAIQHDNAVHVFGLHGWHLGATQRMTFCVLQLKNGFTVTGESACVSAENFDAQIGRDIARASAIEKIWLLLGFRLADKLASR